MLPHGRTPEGLGIDLFGDPLSSDSGDSDADATEPVRAVDMQAKCLELTHIICALVVIIAQTFIDLVVTVVVYAVANLGL